MKPERWNRSAKSTTLRCLRGWLSVLNSIFCHTAEVVEREFLPTSSMAPARRVVEQTGGVNAQFARDAVAEIRRSFDLMELMSNNAWDKAIQNSHNIH